MNRQQSGPPPVGARPPSNDKAVVVYEEVRSLAAADMKVIRAMLKGDKALAEQFAAVAFSSLAKNNDVLRNASPASIIQAIKDAASAGLSIDGQEGAIVQYDGIAQFMPMYRGHLKRIRNSGKVQDIDCQIVYDADEFDYGWTEKGGWFTHKPANYKRDDDGSTPSRGGYWGVYAYAVMPSGFVELEVMTEAQVNEIRDRYGRTHTRSGKPLPWATNYDEMARKTAIRRLEKRLPGAAVDVLIHLEAAHDVALDRAVTVSPPRQEDLDMRAIAMRATGSVEAPQADAEPEPEQSVSPDPVEPQRGSEGPQRGRDESVAGAGDGDLIRQAMEMNRHGTQER